VSLDYGKSVRWRGRGPIAARDSARLEALQSAKRSTGARWSRAHNVPADSNIYAWLLRSGVDLIGTKDLRASRRELERCSQDWRQDRPASRDTIP
jgi:hypothetical protein